MDPTVAERMVLGTATGNIRMSAVPYVGPVGTAVDQDLDKYNRVKPEDAIGNPGRERMLVTFHTPGEGDRPGQESQTNTTLMTKEQFNNLYKLRLGVDEQIMQNKDKLTEAKGVPAYEQQMKDIRANWAAERQKTLGRGFIPPYEDVGQRTGSVAPQDVSPDTARAWRWAMPQGAIPSRVLPSMRGAPTPEQAVPGHDIGAPLVDWWKQHMQFGTDPNIPDQSYDRP